MIKFLETTIDENSDIFANKVHFDSDHNRTETNFVAVKIDGAIEFEVDGKIEE